MKQWSRKHQTVAHSHRRDSSLSCCAVPGCEDLQAWQQCRSASASQWWEMAPQEGEQANSWSDHTRSVHHGHGLLPSTCWPCIYNVIVLGCDLFREWIPISVTDSALGKHDTRLQHSINNSSLTDQLWYAQPYFISRWLMKMVILFLTVLHCPCPWKSCCLLRAALSGYFFTKEDIPQVGLFM